MANNEFGPLPLPFDEQLADFAAQAQASSPGRLLFDSGTSLIFAARYRRDSPLSYAVGLPSDYDGPTVDVFEIDNLGNRSHGRVQRKNVRALLDHICEVSPWDVLRLRDINAPQMTPRWFASQGLHRLDSEHNPASHPDTWYRWLNPSRRQLTPKLSRATLTAAQTARTE